MCAMFQFFSFQFYLCCMHYLMVLYLMENIFSYVMDGPRIEYYIIYLTPVYVDLTCEIVGRLGHTSNIINFSASAG